MASPGEHINDANVDKTDVDVNSTSTEIKMESTPGGSGGTKRKLDDDARSNPLPPVDASSPQSPPHKKKKSLKIRLSLSGGSSKKVKVVDVGSAGTDADDQKEMKSPPSIPDAIPTKPRTTDGPRDSAGTATSATKSVFSKMPSSSRRIKLSLPKSSVSSMAPPPGKKSIQASGVAGGGSSSGTTARQTKVVVNGNGESAKKQRRSSTGRFVGKNTSSSNNINNSDSRSLANATILPMTSPGLMVVGAGKNNLIPPRVIFDQAMVSAGYTTESRTKNPHRGSSVKRVVADMFDSTTTLRLHFPRLVPNHFLKRPEADTSHKPPANLAMPAPMTPPPVINKPTSTFDANKTSLPTSNDTSTSMDVDKDTVDAASKEGQNIFAATSQPATTTAVIEKEKRDVIMTDADDTTNRGHHRLGESGKSEHMLKEEKVVDSTETEDTTLPPHKPVNDSSQSSSLPATSSENKISERAKDTPVVPVNCKSITDGTVLATAQSAEVTTAGSMEASEDNTVKEDTQPPSDDFQHAPQKSKEDSKIPANVDPDAKAEETKSDLVATQVSDPKSNTEKPNNSNGHSKSHAQPFASPAKAHKAEKKPSWADRLIRAFGKRALGASKGTAKARASNALRPFAGMIPMSLTLPYPDEYILRQAKYMREVKQRERAIVARQQDTQAIEVDKEAAEMLGKTYMGPTTSKIVIPSIPQPPRQPRITEMKKLDSTIFGQKAEERLYPLKNTKNEHLDPHCFHITEGRYFGLECNRTFDPNWNGPNCLGFNGLSMTSANSLALTGGSAVPLLSDSAISFLEANVKSEDSSRVKVKGEKKKSATPRPPPKRDESGKFISAKKAEASSPTQPFQEYSTQPKTEVTK